MISVAIIYTALWTVTSISMEIARNKKIDSDRLQNLEKVIVPVIENSAWNFDMAQLQIQLNNILNSPKIVRVRLREEGSNKNILFDQKNESDYSNVLELNYPLYSPTNTSEKINFATLSVFMSNDGLKSKLITGLFSTLLQEGLEIFFLCLILLYFFKYLVTNFILKISAFFENNQYFTRNTHKLDRPHGKYKDEIDNLIDNINKTIEESIKYQSEIESLKNKAEEANRAKSIFLANANHELRTPLNAILGTTELLSESPDSTERNKLMAMQKKAGFHLLNLIDEILDLSKIEAGEIKFETTSINLRNIIETCKMITALDFKEKNNLLNVSISNTFPDFIMGDEARISQIIINLINNANKFTSYGVVEIKVQESDAYFTITITDNGIGIPADKINEIFLPFKRIEKNLRIKAKGYGMGLSIAKSLVELMKGSIHVESQLGKGSIFTIRVPLVKSVEKIIQKQQSNAILNFAKDRCKILVAEDVEDNQFLIKAFLKTSNINLVFAENGFEAVKKFKEDLFSLVFMDLQMPIMDGYSATREIRLYEQNNKILTRTPIIALTAYTTKNDLDLALAAGCDDYITKPFTKNKLFEIIKQYLEAPKDTQGVNPT